MFSSLKTFTPMFIPLFHEKNYVLISVIILGCIKSILFYYNYYSPVSFSHQCLLLVSYWNLSDCKSTKVS